MAKKPPIDRRMAPFSNLENTDWGREQDRRHRANLREFKALRKLTTSNAVAIADNTTLTMLINGQLKTLIEDTDPYVKVRRAIKRGGERASRWANFWAGVGDKLVRLGRGGFVLVVLGIIVWSLFHGGTVLLDWLRVLRQLIWP